MLDLNWTAENDRLEAVTLLLDAGASIDNRNAAGNTALHSGARMGQARMVKLLLDTGASISRQGTMGKPCCTMGPNGCAEVVKLLLERGADMSLKDHPQAACCLTNDLP